MKNLKLEQLIIGYQSLNRIPINKLIEALKESLSDLKNVKIGFLGKDILKKDYSEDVAQVLFIMNSQKLVKKNEKDRIISLSIHNNALFYYSFRETISYYPIWFSKCEYLESDELIKLLPDFKFFLDGESVSLDKYYKNHPESLGKIGEDIWSDKLIRRLRNAFN